MVPRPRGAASGYVEVFILVGIALGGTGLVFGAAEGWLGASSGPSAQLVSASIRQGLNSAVESVTVADVGTSPLGDVVIDTSQAPGPALYCYAVEDPGNGTLVSSSCPPASSGPGAVSVPVDLRPGESVTVEILITEGAFEIGSSHEISVTSSSGAQASAYALVVPA